MKRRKILLAEDDQDDQHLFIDFLSAREDILVSGIVEDGVGVIKFLDNIIATEDLPELIILDHNMPRCNGLQTLKQLKGNTKYSGIPVVIYSTYIDGQLETSCLAAGARTVISKPVTMQGYMK